MPGSCFLLNLLFYYPSISSVWGLTSLLLVLYYGYSKVVAGILEKTKIPKLYKITALHSLWMGLIHLMTFILCFLQINTFLHHSVSETLPQPFFPMEVLYAVSANFYQHYSLSLGKNISEDSCRSQEELHEWSLLSRTFIYIVCAILIQEILLAARNKVDHIFYSRLLGLIFVTTAGRLRYPILSIQGTYLMSINSSSKEIARALVAWKSYSQEDCDSKPSPVLKFLTFLFFMIHMFIWFSVMLFYLPFFIHKLPSVTKNDADRFFLAYSYLSILAYTVVEAATSPLWTTIRCLGWCRRSSGTTWRILALSDCYLLGHYSPLILELYEIQMILDQRKALFRSKMIQKHLALVEGRKRKAESDSQIRRPPNLLESVKTVMAFKKKLRRRKDLLGRSDSLEDQLQEERVTPEDSNIKGEVTSEDEEVIALLESNEDFDDTSKAVLEDEPEAFDKDEEELLFEIGEESTERSFIEAPVSREGTAT